MTLNFDQQITEVTRQINFYIKKGTIIPNKLLDYYSNLLGIKKLIEESSSNSLTPLNVLSYTDFSTISIINTPNTIEFIVLQNNGSSNIYFSPFINNGPFTKNNAFVLIPGANWSTDKPQFTVNGMSATSETTLGSILVVHYIGSIES